MMHRVIPMSLGLALALALVPSLVAAADQAQGLLADLAATDALASTPYAEARDALVSSSTWGDDQLVAVQSHEDWRLALQAEVVLGWRQQPALFHAVATARPVRSRSGRMAFVDQAFEDPRSRPALLERLLHGGDDTPVREGLAVRLAATGPNWDAFVPRLLAVEPDPGVRAVLVWTLRGASGAQTVPALAAALADESPRVRAQAARNAGYLDEPSAIEPALVSTLSDLDPAVRAAAARSLGWLESSEAAGALELLLADRTSEVRLRALRALSRIDPARSGLWDRLPALEQDPDSRVARLARRLTQTRP